MSELKQWMDGQARGIAQTLAQINLRETGDRWAGGYGLRTRALTFLETVKSALFPTLYEVGAVTPGHLVTLSEERIYAAAEQLKAIAREAGAYIAENTQHIVDICLKLKEEGRL